MISLNTRAYSQDWRVVSKKVAANYNNGQDIYDYGIHRVYYFEDGSIYYIEQFAEYSFASELGLLKEKIEDMIKAFSKPTLKYEDSAKEMQLI